MIPYPQGLTFDEWSAVVIEQFALTSIPVGLPWREFGERLLEADATNSVPQTGAFGEWQDWAERVVEMLDNE